METKTTVNWIRVVIITGIALIAAGVFYWIGSNYNIPESTSTATLVTPSTTTATTASETADWKTYTNDSFGFSVKYPNDYVATNASGYSENDGVFIKASNSDITLMSVEGEQSSQSLDSYVANIVNDGFGEPTKMTFVGQSAYEGVDQGMARSYGIIVKKGANIFHIVLYTGNTEGLAKSKAVLTAIQKQILSTFQFTK